MGARLALLGTEGGRRRMLAAVDRARAGLGRPVDGPARYQMAELGMVLERCFFVPDDSVLLPSLLATARPAAASLAPILVAWLDADSGGGPDAPDGARAAPTRATLTPGRRAARTATAA